jgi:hypothetical protein
MHYFYTTSRLWKNWYSFGLVLRKVGVVFNWFVQKLDSSDNFKHTIYWVVSAMIFAGIETDRQASRQADVATQLCVYLILYTNNK